MKITDEMAQAAQDALERVGIPFDAPPVRYLRLAMEAAMNDTAEPNRWAPFSDEDLETIGHSCSERAQRAVLPDDVRARNYAIDSEVRDELNRRRGGYRGPGVYRSFAGNEYEVLGVVESRKMVIMRHHGTDAVLRECLLEEQLTTFNASNHDGRPNYVRVGDLPSPDADLRVRLDKLPTRYLQERDTKQIVSAVSLEDLARAVNGES